MRENKGITLVALVVTVIILLIIAGVAISMITGNDGLFTKANEAATLYNEEARKEAEWLQQLMDSEYLNGTGGSGSGSGATPTIPTVTGPLSNGSFDNTKKVNTPDVSKLPIATTRYIVWTDNGSGAYSEEVLMAQPQNWYDYANGKWANILSNANGLKAYWVWIPRFAYKLPEAARGSEKEIEVIFVKNDSKKGVLADGTEVDCYYSTDVEITTDGSGLYNSKTTDATDKWIIHPAFWWDNNNNMVRDDGEEINGFWVAKFEPSKNGEKVEVVNGVTSWREVTIKNAFEATRAMQNTGGAIGSTTGTTTIDTHMAKNMEWGAVSILTHSKFGIYNSSSAVKNETTRTRVWNNPNSSYITGTVSSTAFTGSNDSATRDAASLVDTACDRYNVGNGPKGSSTGTVYGVYDLAGGSWEYVMGVMSTDNNITPTTPSVTVGSSGYASTSVFTSAIDRKYYNVYKTGAWNAYTGRGYIGDMTEELKPTADNSHGYLWYDDYASFVNSSSPFFGRGGQCSNGAGAGATAFSYGTGGTYAHISFRPILLIP